MTLKNSILALLLILIFLIPWPTIMAQTIDANSPEGREVSQKTLIDLFYAGGPLMWWLLLCSIGTLAAMAWCFVEIRASKMFPKSIHQALLRHAQTRNVGEAWQLCQDHPSSYSKTVASALLHVNYDRDMANKPSMEQAAGETLDDEETRQMQWINSLNVLGTMAPMIGLLGTITGMIASFDQLSAGKSEPSDLAGGIGEAMITTAGGLLVGIPAMFFYFFFRGRLQLIMSEIHKQATFLINVISGEVKLAGDHATEREWPSESQRESSEPVMNHETT